MCCTHTHKKIMKKTATPIAFPLLIGLIVCFVGCDGQTRQPQTTPTASSEPTFKTCPNCNGIGRYDQCVGCVGIGGGTADRLACIACAGTGTRLCGYCNGRGTVTREAYPDVRRKMVADEMKMREELSEQQREQREREERRATWQRIYDGIMIGWTEREVLDFLNPNHPEVGHFSTRENPQRPMRDGRIVGGGHTLMWERRDPYFGLMFITATLENGRVIRKDKAGF